MCLDAVLPLTLSYFLLKAPMVDSTVEVFQRISQELLPTPAKSHYTFNLRDLSKVFVLLHFFITLLSSLTV